MRTGMQARGWTAAVHPVTFLPSQGDEKMLKLYHPSRPGLNCAAPRLPQLAQGEAAPTTIETVRLKAKPAETGLISQGSTPKGLVPTLVTTAAVLLPENSGLHGVSSRKTFFPKAKLRPAATTLLHCASARPHSYPLLDGGNVAMPTSCAALLLGDRKETRSPTRRRMVPKRTSAAWLRA